MENKCISALERHVDYKLLEILVDNNIETTDDLIERAEWLERLPEIGPKRALAIRQGLTKWYVEQCRKKYPDEALVIDALYLKWRWKLVLHRHDIMTMAQARWVAETSSIKPRDTLYTAKQAARNAITYGRPRELRVVAN
jgi:hypothetical protein